MGFRGLGVIAGWMAALVTAITGCDEVENVETPVYLAWGQSDNDLCVDPRGVDTFVVDVFAYDGPLGDLSTQSPCMSCGDEGSGATCTHLQRQCLCSGLRPTQYDVAQALKGLRFDGLSSDLSLCVRIVALRRSSSLGGLTEGPAQLCGEEVAECHLSSWNETVDIAVINGAADLCALSDPQVLSGSDAPIIARYLLCRRMNELWALLADFVSEHERLDWSRLCDEFSWVCEGPEDEDSFESCVRFMSSEDP